MQKKNLPTPPNSYDFNQNFLDINDVKHIRQEIVVPLEFTVKYVSYHSHLESFDSNFNCNCLQNRSQLVKQ